MKHPEIQAEDLYSSGIDDARFWASPTNRERLNGAIVTWLGVVRVVAHGEHNFTRFTLYMHGRRFRRRYPRFYRQAYIRRLAWRFSHDVRQILEKERA